MPLKIKVDLPNGTVITLEVSEPDAYAQVAGQVLKELSRGTDHAPVTPVPQPPQPAPITPSSPLQEKGGGQDEFLRFCQRLSPKGDMRRVVVAAEGARRFLGLPHVSERELAQLFQQAGWDQPKLFVQTIRNAARRKFDWLQRVPGRGGYYIVTEKGRREVVGQ